MAQENIFHGIFKDKIVLITGHTGFQGSWLSLWLKMLGANVVGFSLEPPSNPYLFKILDMENEVTSITADLCDKKNIHSLTKAMIKIIELDYENLKILGMNARKKVERKFDEEIVISQYIKLLK